MLDDHRLAILGFGTMGQAIATGIVRSGAMPADRIRATTIDLETGVPAGKALGIVVDSDNAAAARDATVLLVCTKPWDVPRVIGDLHAHGHLSHRPLILSIAAGVRLEQLESASGGQCPLIRVMPNTAARIGQGMSVLARGPMATDQHLAIARALFETVGRVIELDEKHLDAVTALAGSGPAFVYTILDAMADGGVRCGLPRAVALEIAAQTVLGAAAMTLQTGRHPAVLRDEVTTPGGCTIAGLLVLEDRGLRATVARAVEEAARVAGELG